MEFHPIPARTVLKWTALTIAALYLAANCDGYWFLPLLALVSLTGIRWVEGDDYTLTTHDVDRLLNG